MSDIIFCPDNFSLNALKYFKVIFRRPHHWGSRWILVFFKRRAFTCPFITSRVHRGTAVPVHLRKYLHVCLSQFWKFFLWFQRLSTAAGQFVECWSCTRRVQGFCRSRLIWEESEIRRADTTQSGVRLTTSSCRQKSQLQDESHLVTDSLLWDSWFLSFLSFGAEYLSGAELANCSTELLETNLTSGGWQPALRNQQSTEDWWSILMLQLHCFLPWVSCSAGGWEGHGVKGTSLAWTDSRSRFRAGGICLSLPKNWKEIVTQILQRSGARIAALTSLLCPCLAYGYVCCLEVQFKIKPLYARYSTIAKQRDGPFLKVLVI